MDLQDLLRNPVVMDQLARSIGAGSGETRTGLEALLPAVMKGIERNAATPTGLESLTKALGSGAHDRYLEAPERLAAPETRQDGNAILGHIFGSKDVSRNVAGHASQQTGISSDLLKKMLPIVASIAMGALSKQSNRGSQFPPQAQAQQGGGGLGDLLGPILGSVLGASVQQQQNDSPLDDILDLAKKFL